MVCKKDIYQKELVKKWKNNKKTSKIDVEINDIVFIRILHQKRDMPQYLACKHCDKTGMVADATGRAVECPCCGSAARRMLGLEGFLNQAGWTTKDRINAYYRQMAERDSRAIAEHALENLARRFSEAGQPPMSNQLRKHKEKEIMSKMMAHLLAGKYKLLE